MQLKPNYFFIPLVTILVALVGSSYTTLGMEWYDTSLTHPALTPPDWVFPIAWNTIFLLSTISALILWNKGEENSKFFHFLHNKEENKRYWAITILFIANAILNVLWSYLFFVQRQLQAAFVEMIILELTTIALIVLGWKTSRLAAVFLLPYAIWVGFASYLTYQIIQLN